MWNGAGSMFGSLCIFQESVAKRGHNDDPYSIRQLSRYGTRLLRWTARLAFIYSEEWSQWFPVPNYRLPQEDRCKVSAAAAYHSCNAANGRLVDASGSPGIGRG